MQLMAKNRYFEMRDSRLLEAFEQANGMEVVHGRTLHAGDRAWYHVSSYVVWMCTLAVFAIAAFLVILGVTLGWGWLATVSG
jgi:hypothetical protein